MNTAATPHNGPAQSAEGATQADPLRILFAGELWHGSDSYAYLRAFRRAGHSVAAIETANYLPTGWKTKWLRALRRALEPVLVAEYERDLIAMAHQLKPDLFFGFKAPYATAKALRAVKETGAVAINFYPDVSVMAHGKYLPQTLPLYDWVFTAKTFGMQDMEREIGITNSSFMPPAFDPEVHAPFVLSKTDLLNYQTDVSFIGTWSPWKERAVEQLRSGVPDADLKIWGYNWEQAGAPVLDNAIQNKIVVGTQYARCIRASRINLGLLSERVAGASMGDQITARTFQIPASGGFMMHERTDEITAYFEDGKECALFSDASELAEKVRYYLAHEDERQQVALAGRARALASGYSVDTRIKEVVAKYRELKAL